MLCKSFCLCCEIAQGGGGLLTSLKAMDDPCHPPHRPQPWVMIRPSQSCSISRCKAGSATDLQQGFGTDYQRIGDEDAGQRGE